MAWSKPTIYFGFANRVVSTLHINHESWWKDDNMEKRMVELAAVVNSTHCSLLFFFSFTVFVLRRIFSGKTSVDRYMQNPQQMCNKFIDGQSSGQGKRREEPACAINPKTSFSIPLLYFLRYTDTWISVARFSDFILGHKWLSLIAIEQTELRSSDRTRRAVVRSDNTCHPCERPRLRHWVRR